MSIEEAKYIGILWNISKLIIRWQRTLIWGRGTENRDAKKVANDNNIRSVAQARFLNSPVEVVIV